MEATWKYWGKTFEAMPHDIVMLKTGVEDLHSSQNSQKTKMFILELKLIFQELI